MIDRGEQSEDMHFRCYDCDATMKFMSPTDSILPARSKYLLAALSVVGLALSNPLAIGSSLIHENVGDQSVSDHADVRTRTPKKMAFMEISGPKRTTQGRTPEVGAKTFAQQSESNGAPSDEKKAVGCYVNNVWYPEGAIYPPQEPGKMTGTVVTYVCREGKWIIRRKDG